MLEYLLLAQAELAPKFQPGPARVPDQIPIIDPNQSVDNPVLENNDEPVPSNSPKTLEAVSGRLETYQKQDLTFNNSTVYTDADLKSFIQSCRLDPETKKPEEWAALCITIKYQQDGYINTRAYFNAESDQSELEIVEGKITELRVSGDNDKLNKKLERKLSSLKGKPLNANDVQRAIRIIQQLPGVQQIQARLGRIGSDARDASLIVLAIPKGSKLSGQIGYDNYGKVSAGENRTQFIVSQNSLLQFDDTWLFYSDHSWTGNPELGSSTYSTSYVTPIGRDATATVSVGFSKTEPIELSGLSKDFRTNQFQITGLARYQFLDSYDTGVGLYGQVSYNRSNLYLEGKQLPDIVPDLIRKPQNGYFKLGLEASKINQQSIHSGKVFFSQALAGVIPNDQQQSLDSIGIDSNQARSIGASLDNQFVLKNGVRIKASVAAQKALAPLVGSMRFQVGADSGLVGLPGSIASGDSGIQLNAEGFIPLAQTSGWNLGLKPFAGFATLSTETPLGERSNTVGATGAMLNITNQTRQWSFDIGWAYQYSDRIEVKQAWENWSLGHGLLMSFNLRL